MFHKIQILPASIQNPFLEIHPFTGCGGGGGGGGLQHNPAGLPYPPPKILELRIWLRLAQWFQRSSRLKVWTDE